MTQAVHVNRGELSKAKIVAQDWHPLPEGAVRLRVESFAVTANNITYAVIGDQFGYWNFFPAEEGMGIVPVWGHAVVEESAHDEIAVGERVYGYLPMATHLTVMPGKVGKHGFMDTAPHRQPMSPIYNQYTRLAADPEHDPAKEAERLIFGPLFKTGFLIENFFRRNDWFGAEGMIVTSASSKTAMALASVTRHRSPQITKIGLTSPGNIDFLLDADMVDEFVSYRAIGDITEMPFVLVDFAGNADIVRRLHTERTGTLRYSCLVGMTHVPAQGDAQEEDSAVLPGPEPILFFAPDHAVAAAKELGPEAFGDQVASSWRQFLKDVTGTIEIERRDGIEAARDTYLAMLGGAVDPAKGVVIRP